MRPCPGKRTVGEFAELRPEQLRVLARHAVVVAVHQSVADDHRAALGGAEQLTQVRILCAASLRDRRLGRSTVVVQRDRPRRRAFHRVVGMRRRHVGTVGCGSGTGPRTKTLAPVPRSRCTNPATSPRVNPRPAPPSSVTPHHPTRTRVGPTCAAILTFATPSAASNSAFAR